MCKYRNREEITGNCLKLTQNSAALPSAVGTSETRYVRDIR